jgi:hypothetical protein
MPVKSVPIQLDRRRQLRFDFNAFASLQRECGMSILDLQKFVGLAALGGTMQEPGMLLPLYELRGFIWAGLLDESPNITLKEVGDILDEHLMERPNEIGKSLVEAIMESSFFKAAEKKAQGPKPTTVKKRTGPKRTTSEKITSSPLE